MDGVNPVQGGFAYDEGQIDQRQVSVEYRHGFKVDVQGGIDRAHGDNQKGHAHQLRFPYRAGQKPGGELQGGEDCGNLQSHKKEQQNLRQPQCEDHLLFTKYGGVDEGGYAYAGKIGGDAEGADGEGGGEFSEDYALSRCRGREQGFETPSFLLARAQVGGHRQRAGGPENEDHKGQGEGEEHASRRVGGWVERLGLHGRLLCL